MTAQEALRILSQLLPPESLDEGRIFVFQRAWIGKNYRAIAQESSYTYDYICKAGASLWQMLSAVLGVEVTWENFRALLKNHAERSTPRLARTHELPGGPVPIGSPFYITRPLIEAKAFAELAKPGALLRLKAPQKMGKSTLMLRLIEHALSLNYRPLFLDLQLTDREMLSNPDRFLRWFCANISRQLEVTPQFDQYWHAELSSRINFFVYLQSYLLQQINTPIVLLINEVNRIFDYPVLAQEFLSLVRSLNEASRYTEVLQKLRLVLAYSTEIYVPLQLYQSPFNVGQLIEFPELSLAEIQMLAERYGLSWLNPGCHHASKLHALVGGHPYLVQLALYHLAHRVAYTSPEKGADILSQLLAAASTLDGIYSDHLQRHLSVLYTHPELMIALKQVLVEVGAELHPMQQYKLQSLGLIKLQSNRVQISCKLYQLFFSRYILRDLPLNLEIGWLEGL